MLDAFFNLISDHLLILFHMIGILESHGCRIESQCLKANWLLNYRCNIFKKLNNALMPFFI